MLRQDDSNRYNCTVPLPIARTGAASTIYSPHRLFSVGNIAICTLDTRSLYSHVSIKDHIKKNKKTIGQHNKNYFSKPNKILKRLKKCKHNLRVQLIIEHFYPVHRSILYFIFFPWGVGESHISKVECFVKSKTALNP